MKIDRVDLDQALGRSELQAAHSIADGMKAGFSARPCHRTHQKMHCDVSGFGIGTGMAEMPEAGIPACIEAIVFGRRDCREIDR